MRLQKDNEFYIIDLYKKKLNVLQSTLNDKQLSSIHFQSVNNFLKYFPGLKNETIQNNVTAYLDNYFRNIEEKNYDLTQSESNEVYQSYIMKIGTFYNAELNFQVYMEPKWAFFIGLHIDLILFIFGVLKKIHYVPIATLSLGGYFLYLYFFYKKRDKIYGSGI